MEPLENRHLLSVAFEDINPNNSDGDATDADRASMGRVNGLASVGRQNLGTANNDIFYAASEWGGLYKTTDSGLNWFHLDNHLPTAMFDVEVDPANTNRVYATSFFDGRVDSLSGIEVSTDAGANWVHPVTAEPDPTFEGTGNDNTPQAGYTCGNARDEISAFGIAIQPDAPQNVFVGTSCGLARSTNNGLTWQFISPDTTPLTPPPAATFIWDVTADAAGVVNVLAANGDFRSIDGGNTWTQGTLPAAARNNLGSLATSPDENYVLLVGGADNQFYESDDGGQNWLALGSVDPILGGGRLPFIQSNQRTAGFDVWTGGVTLYRVACTTPAAPAQQNINAPGAVSRCPVGANPTTPPAAATPAGWFGGYTRSGLFGNDAHDDVGDIVFDSEAANDAAPTQHANDGGVYRNLLNNGNPTVAGDIDWEQPAVGPHALWLFGMTGVNDPANTNDEDLYFGLQDNGVFGTTNAGAAAVNWHNDACCDGFDLAADATQVIYTRGFSNTGRNFRLKSAGPGMTGPNETDFPAANYPATGQVTQFKFSESIDNYGANTFAIVMLDCPANTPGACPNANAGDGGVFFTTNMNAGPPTWTELAEPAGMNSAQLLEVQVALSGGTPTFYVQVGTGDRAGGDQLWRRVNTTNPTDTTQWTRIDNTTLTNTAAAMAGGIGFFSVDPNNPNFLYAFNSAAGSPQMVFSTDGGTNWTIDPELNNLMMGGGAFKATNAVGPTNFTSFNGYSEPSLVAIDPEDSRNIVAGGQDSGVFLSTDGGASWRLLSDPYGAEDDPATTLPNGFAKDDTPNLPRPYFAYFDHEPAGTLRIFVGTEGYGVWRIVIDGTAFDLPPDRFEPNNTIGTSTVLGSLQKITERDLTIHNVSDVDFFQYTAEDTGKVIVNTYFDLSGDLDLRVRDAAGNIIATGTQTNVAGGRVRENLVIPVVSQQRYYIEVFSGVQHTNEYDLEIENFEAPVPQAVLLDPLDDSGMFDNDNITSETTPQVFVLADLSDFAAEGIDILTPAEIAANEPGAAVEVFRNGVSRGFATADGSSDSTVFSFTFGAGELSQGLNFVTAAVRIFDGKTPQVDGRAQLSEPLLLRLDTTAPATPAAPNLLAASDSGMFNNDNVTNKMEPAFDGTTERNAKVRVKADGIVVGEGTATSAGHWEVTVEPLRDAVHQITVEVEDLAGNVSLMSQPLSVEIDTLSPNTPHLDLVESSDSGRHDDDNITNDNTPGLSMTTDDPNAASHLLAANFKYRVFDRLEESAETLAFDSGALTALTQRTATLAALADGVHNLKLEVEDRAGNISEDFLLDVLVDTVAPSGTANLFPDSDTGIWGFGETMDDLVTADMTPLLFGRTEADALVRAAIDDVPGGTAVAIPLDGDDAFPPPPEFDGNYFLQTILNLMDGEHTIEVFFQDVAGNESPADDDATIVLFIDTAGPRITNVTRGEVSVDNVFSFDGVTSLFEPKPSPTGPDPLIHSIVIHFSDLPDRTAAFADVPALFEALAAEEGNYSLKGDHNGYIAIVDVNVTFTTIPDDGLPETADVELVFDAPLPDDRYTLFVSETITDPAGNPLDGESGALGPFEGNDVPSTTPPIFPTGDGEHGGDFWGRFTVDSRPEIGTFAQGSVYIDINGNFNFDHEGEDRDYTNRDIAFLFGFRDDKVFAGNFAAAGALSATGYDKLGAFGNAGTGAAWHWRLDFNHDGVVDYDVLSGVQNSADPVAGNFSLAHPGDEIGLFNSGKWYLDSGGDNNVGGPGDTQLNGNMKGQPLVGDFDGDGLDDLAAWDAGNAGTQFDGVFQFDLANNGRTGVADKTIQFDIAGVFQRAVAADMNGDGIDDIGLFVTRREAVPPSEAAEWFFLISDVSLKAVGQVSALAHSFTPVPFGNDIFAQFGDEAGLPVVGNFDPPTSTPVPSSVVLGRNIFYSAPSSDGSTSSVGPVDDAVIAPDKTPLLPGQTATFANYTSDSRGIHGVMFDIYRLPDPAALSARDFEFRAGNGGDPALWPVVTATPIVSVRPAAGVGGADRVFVTWPDNTIQNQWLRVTILANTHTGLTDQDVHYWGNAIGETGNLAGDTRVDFADQIAVEAHRSTTATVESPYDFNRDGQIDAADVAITVAYATGLTGDLNRDDRVDLVDAALLQSHFGAAISPYDGDLDGDGTVGRVDLVQLARLFGSTPTTEMLSRRLTILTAPGGEPQAAAAVVVVSQNRSDVSALRGVRRLDGASRAHELRVVNDSADTGSATTTSLPPERAQLSAGRRSRTTVGVRRTDRPIESLDGAAADRAFAELLAAGP